MTPQLMQAIKLLQLSNLDLAAYVEGELERNPLLERAERRATTAAGGAPSRNAAARRAASDDRAEAADWIGEDLETSRTAMEERLGTELENVFPGRRRRRAAPGAGDAAAGLFGMVRRRRRRRARTATTIWKPSSPPRRRSPTISPSSWRWRFPIRPAA